MRLLRRTSVNVESEERDSECKCNLEERIGIEREG